MKAYERGSWTPFSWVEKYAYAFSGPYNKAEVALTFDDGPDLEFTPKILDKLKQHNVKATFFLLGENAEKFPNVVKRIANEGHVIGNHTYSHPNLAKVNEDEYRNQIIKTEEILNRLAGYAPKFIRPPYGEILEKSIKNGPQSKIFVIVQWSVDTVDWKGVSADTITNNVLGNSFQVVSYCSILPRWAFARFCRCTRQNHSAVKNERARFVTLPSMFQTSKRKKVNVL